MKKLTAIDLFSGAGGLSFGLELAGFDVRLAVDWDKNSILTHGRNMSAPAIVADLSELSGAQILAMAGLDDLDLLAGGPPCQGFSVQRRGDATDERNKLVFEYLRLVDEIRPRAFIMENVAAIAGPRGRFFLNSIMTAATELGYSVKAEVLDAANFGVPQHRKRLFLAGVRSGEAIEFPHPTHGPSSWVTVRDAFKGLPDPFDDPEGASAFHNHERDNISPKNRERISYVPEGGGREDIPEELRLPCHRVSVATAGHRGVYGRLWWDRPSGTITTKCNSFTRGRFAHPVQPRNITMREAARLQGFPDEFIFVGDKVSVAHQIGNAVPPALAAAVANAVYIRLAVEYVAA